MIRALLLLSLAALALSAEVTVLTPDNFDEVVNGQKNVLVEFYAPWCGHCKSLAPEYEQAALAFKGNTHDIVIASVDADAHKALGSRFGVQGFPTLKWFEKGADVSKPEDYNAGRTAQDLIEFVNKETGSKAILKKAPSFVKVLTTSNFDSVVNGEKHVLVEFYAPWCGHCKSLAPKWEELAKIFAGDKNIVIAKVDADAASGRPLGEKFGVKGFPTIKFFKKGNTVADAYEAGREVSDFITFLNENANAQRQANGALDASAGRVAGLDELIRKYLDGDKTVASEIKAFAGDSANVKFYKTVFDKFVSEGASWVDGTRSRMKKVLDGGESLAPSKRDEFAERINILNVFVAE